MQKSFPNRSLTAVGIAALFTITAFADKEKAPETGLWTDPVKAAAEHPDFTIQGEYIGKIDKKKIGVQASALDKGKFLVATYEGGLPGDGWDGKSKITSEILERADLEKKIAGLERTERQSPTLGDKAPKDALVIFDGTKTEHVKGQIEDGLLWAGSETTTAVGSFKMHLEFRLPFKPATIPSSQDRGNSGVYIYNNYECQVIDSFALDLIEENNAVELKSKNNQWCGSFYKTKLPDTPMVYPPLTWQTYEIDFTAPVFEGDKKVKNARITVKQNGVLIHDDFELKKGTGAGGGRPEKEKGLIHFQGHGNPVAYRNVWIVEKK